MGSAHQCIRRHNESLAYPGDEQGARFDRLQEQLTDTLTKPIDNV